MFINTLWKNKGCYVKKYCSMKFNDYLTLVQKQGKLSAVKILILKTLWGNNNNSYSSDWIPSRELLAVTNQKYFDRRARELRDQCGCDIETKIIPELGGYCWRLKSPVINTLVNREYLSEKQKTQLFESYGYRCSTCGLPTNPGIRGLQADHKVPLSRNGTNDFSNWQPMCNNCNVGKRRACEGCEKDCNQCSWAYPEIMGVPIILSLPNKLLESLKSYSKINNRSESEVVAEATTIYLKIKK